MVSTDSLADCRTLLTNAGLSPAGLLKSTGVQRHLERAEQGQISPSTIIQYAADLRELSAQSGADGTAIPSDFWDVRTPEMAGTTRSERSMEALAQSSPSDKPDRQGNKVPLGDTLIVTSSRATTPGMAAAAQDEYAMVHALSRPEYREYVRLLGRCYGHLCRFKAGRGVTAVATALSMLREVTVYIREGHCTEMTSSCHGLKPEQQAIFLWQQVVTGTNRQVPYLHRDAYTHGNWGRFNVVEMWRYGVGSEIAVDDVWGLSGFAPQFIRDSTNTNQIEHMTISALAQMVLGLPALFLDILEDMEWVLRKGTYAASQADKGVNRAVARRFRPLFRLDDPEPACESLEQALAADAP